MAFNTSIFTSNANKISDIHSAMSKNRYNREYIISSDVAEDLNTYKNSGIFPLMADLGLGLNASDEDGNIDAEKLKDTAHTGTGFPAVRSIFNVYSGVLTGNDRKVSFENMGIDKMGKIWNSYVRNITDFRYNNAPLLDTPSIREALKDQSACSVRDLVNASKHGDLGRLTYSYADFMYCKYLGKVPNNYLITVRRFPLPVTDSVMPFGRRAARRGEGRPDTQHPIGTMVTWMGVSGNNMDGILTYSYNMPFEEKTANWQDMQKNGGEEGILNQLEAAFNPVTRKAYIQGKGGTGVDKIADSMGGKIPFVGGFFGGGSAPYPSPNETYEQNERVYGPIDRVKSNYQRSDGGLKQTHTFKLTFEYELKAYNGINPKAAMLDLLASIFSVTYTNGDFWKGGYRGGAIRQSSLFTNLNVFKTAQNGGTFTDFCGAIADDLMGFFKPADENGQGGGIFGNILKDAASLMNQMGGILFGSMLNKLGRPAKYRAVSLLSEQPVGLWHIVIGNPKRPIMTMGNMILKNTVITHSGPLGLDDFPTQLKVECEFDRGKPRDQVGLEAMYMKGNDRIYHPATVGIMDMYNYANIYKSATGVSGATPMKFENSDQLDEYLSKIEQQDKSAGKDGLMKGTAPDYKYNIYLREVFGGDPDIKAIVTAAREQAEGSVKRQTKDADKDGHFDRNNTAK